MKKIRITALLLTLVMAVGTLAACAAPAATGDTPAASAPAGGDAPKYVTIGFLSPITGANAAEGAAARNAFEMAIKQANDSGEFPYEIKTIIIDDQSDATVGVAGAQKIVADSSVVCATGHWNSGVAEATIPVFKENEIPFLIWGAIRESLTSAENYP